jgi:hypothetical protein
MIEPLKEAFDAAAQLPEAEQQLLADLIRERIVAGRYWDQLLSDPGRAAAIDALAEEALAEFAAGQTRLLSEGFGDESL